MLYTPATAQPPTSTTAGISTLTIPTGSSSPTTGPLVLALSIDPAASQDPYQLNFLLTTTYAGDPADLTYTLPASAGVYRVASLSPVYGTGLDNLYVALQNGAIPGTFTLTISATDGTHTATAYATLTVATPGGSTIPPAITNGEYSVFAWPASLTLPLDTSATVTVGPYPPAPPLAPLSYTVSGLPSDVLIVPGPITEFFEWQLTFYTSASTAPGIYNLTVTGSWTADPYAPPPANASWAASATLQLTVDPSYSPPSPNYAAPVRGRTYGVVGTRTRAGHVLRALAMPVQPNSPAQVNWRHLFRAYKLAWKSLGPGGANNAPTLSVDPQTAWLMQNLTYNGILTAGLEILGVQAQGTLGPCATGEAFQLLCQTTRAQLNLPPLPTPQVADQYLSFPATPYSQTLGQFTVSVAGNPAPSPTVPGITLLITWQATPLPPAPTAFSAGAAGLDITTTAPTLHYATVVVLLPAAATATWSAGNATFTVPTWSTFASVVGDLLTTTGFAPAGFNVTAAVITANTTNSVTIAMSGNPGPQTTPGLAAIAHVDADWYIAQITCSPNPSTPTGSITLYFYFTDADGLETDHITIDATAGTVSVAFPSPAYTLFLGMRAACTLGPGYEVLGFILQPQWSGVTTQPDQIPGGTVPYLYEITASPQYTSGSGKPSRDKWRVLGFFPNSPILDSSATLGGSIDPAAVLTAWRAKFNDTPDSGYIAFEICLVNPADGTASPAISATASFKAGTATGIDYTSSTCPYFRLATNSQGATGAPGDTITISFVYMSVSYHLCLFETDANSQTGPAAYTATLPYDTTTATYPPLPAWLSLTFGTPTQTAPAEYAQAAHTWYTEYTLHLSGAAPAGTYTIRLGGELPTQKTGTTLTLTVT
jgi:hypothetical protein